jgi:subtilisin family serine protease
VAASTNADDQAYFSNFGTCVDLYAPGVGIPSTHNTSDVAVVSKSGTSMASPHVAGAAALYLESHPQSSPAQVAQALAETATPNVLKNLGAGSPNRLLFTGDAAAAPPPPSPEPEPDPAPSTDQPPTAAFTSSCPRGVCTFNASGSTDDKGIVSYSWDFGDGASITSAGTAIVSHTYTAKGRYTVTLIVVDSAGQSAQAQAIVNVKNIRR